MDPVIIVENLKIASIAAFFMALALSWMIIPSIRAIARRWSLYEFDGSQQVTLSHYPRLGGMAMVVGFGVTSAIFAPAGMVPDIHYLIAGLLLLMAAGIKDDLLRLSDFMRVFMVVAAGVIMTDAGRLPLIFPAIGVVGSFPVVGLLLTYAVLVGCVLLLMSASRIPGLVSVILLASSVALAIAYYRSGITAQVVLPVALAGASAALFGSALSNFVYEGRSTALVGGFIVGVLIVNMGGQPAYSPDFGSLASLSLALFVLPLLVMAAALKHVDDQLFVFNRKIRPAFFYILVLAILVSLSLL